jgi:hypothetical protein
MNDPIPLSEQDYHPVIVKSICPRCNAEDQVEWLRPVDSLRIHCDPCADLARAEEAERLAFEQKAKFLAYMPERYRYARKDEVRPPYDTAAQLIIKTNTETLCMIGQSGAGKTCALSCMVQELQLPYRWHTGPSLKEAWLESATSDHHEAGIIWHRLHTIQLLCIDDISHADFSAKFATAFLQLLSTRIDNLKLTVITSQKGLDQLGKKIAEQCQDRDTAVAIFRRLKAGPVLSNQ